MYKCPLGLRPFSFSAISEHAGRSINQVIDIVGVAVDNLDICTHPCIITAIFEVDSAVNLSLSNSGMSSREPACCICSTVSEFNGRVNQFASSFSS